MNRQKRDVVMLSMSHVLDWQKGIVNRNRFILDTLYKHPLVNRVLAIDFLPFTYKTATKTFFSSPQNVELIHTDMTSRLYQWTSRGYIFQSWLSVFSENKFISQLDAILQKLQFEHFYFWSYNPLFIKPLLHFRDQFLIFDAVDDWSLHASYQNHTSLLRENYQIIDEVSDYIFMVSPELKKYFPHNKDAYWIPNGVDVKHFQEKKQIPLLLHEIKQKGPIIGYIGTIQERMDFDLLEFLAKYHFDKQFVFVGPIWKSVQRKVESLKKRFSNIHFLGRVSYKDSPAFIQHFDVCIIPHRNDAFNSSTNSMKLYEYMACKKPIVSVVGGGVECFSDVLFVAKDIKDFNEKIQQAITGDGEEKENKKEALLTECTWEKRVDKMLHIINRL